MTPSSRPACPICHTPAETWAVCQGCQARVDRQLDALLDLHAYAGHPELRMPRANPDGIGPVGGTHDPAIGQRVDALDLSHGEILLSTDQAAETPPWAGLEAWERAFRDFFGLTPYGIASGRRLEASGSHQSAQEVLLVGVVRFLRSWWPRAALEHPAADEFARDVATMFRWARQALDVAEPRPWTVPCPADLGERECGYRLRVEYVGRGISLHCRRCGSDWDTMRLLLVANAADTPVWVDPETAAEYLGVTERTLRRMAERGEIGRDRGRYDLSRHAG